MLPVKSIWLLSKIFISHLKVLFFYEKVKHHNVFIYYTKYKSGRLGIYIYIYEGH